MSLPGFQARLAAKVSLHNFCLWLNVHLGRDPLAFADLLDWEVHRTNSTKRFIVIRQIAPSLYCRGMIKSSPVLM
jgi:hypothetical protein